jgi:hypothetical protein
MRHRLLGHCAKLFVQSTRSAAAGEPSSRSRSREKGQALDAKTQRERDYIDAIAAMYVEYDKIDHRTRVQRYLAAEEQVATRYPDDDEAQIAYAITLNVAASPADKTYVNQLKGAALLEPILKRQPEHPGVAHYLIHLYDYPALAEKGLEAAKRYAKIAPAAPHAQHMPSHIFHAPRLLERLDCLEQGIRAHCQGGRRTARSSARDGLPSLCLSAAGPGQGGARRRRRTHQA